jgi:hypothetical protein
MAVTNLYCCKDLSDKDKKKLENMRIRYANKSGENLKEYLTLINTTIYNNELYDDGEIDIYVDALVNAYDININKIYDDSTISDLSKLLKYIVLSSHEIDLLRLGFTICIHDDRNNTNHDKKYIYLPINNIAKELFAINIQKIFTYTGEDYIPIEIVILNEITGIKNIKYINYRNDIDNIIFNRNLHLCQIDINHCIQQILSASLDYIYDKCDILDYYDNYTENNPNHSLFYNKIDEIVVNNYIDIINKNNNYNFIKSESLEDYDELILMSLCDHFIIANSTFSWFGAYFSNNPNKIVCYPSKWFGEGHKNNNTVDLFPDGWVKISNP